MTVRERSGSRRGARRSPGRAHAICEGALREIHEPRSASCSTSASTTSRSTARAPALSGGEAQRIRLASQLGSELSGVMYVLDEPSIGLHPRDNARLIETLRAPARPRQQRHRRRARRGDHPRGRPRRRLRPRRRTPRRQGHLRGARRRSSREHEPHGPVPLGRAPHRGPLVAARPRAAALAILGAREHNLADSTCEFPLGVFTAVTGVSGAGKSSLVNGILLPALARALHGSADPVGAHDEIVGLDALDKVIAIDQQPIGRTPRSNPGTYTKAFDVIRESLRPAPRRARPRVGRRAVQLQREGGALRGVRGRGSVKVEMHFLADVWVGCDACNGRRYNAETLEVRFKGKSISRRARVEHRRVPRAVRRHPGPGAHPRARSPRSGSAT